MEGELASAFVPIEKGVYPGYSEKEAISDILDQEKMKKIYEEEKISPIEIGDMIL